MSVAGLRAWLGIALVACTQASLIVGGYIAIFVSRVPHESWLFETLVLISAIGAVKLLPLATGVRYRTSIWHALFMTVLGHISCLLLAFGAAAAFSGDHWLDLMGGVLVYGVLSVYLSCFVLLAIYHRRRSRRFIR